LQICHALGLPDAPPGKTWLRIAMTETLQAAANEAALAFTLTGGRDPRMVSACARAWAPERPSAWAVLYGIGAVEIRTPTWRTSWRSCWA
jgi:hypothetical protein